MTGTITWLGLAASLTLVAVAAGLSLWQRLGLAIDMVWAAGRAMVQLLLVGAALDLVISEGRPLWWAWLWVAVMVAFAAWTVRRRAPEVPGVLRLALAGFAAASTVGLGVLFGLGVFPLAGRTLVPLAGMIVGNAMTATVVVARRTVEELRDRREEVEARLALGLPAADAARPHVRSALRTAMIPQIESTKAVGIVFLPGAMTGLILAGESPASAVMVQVAIMYLILGATAVTTAVTSLGLRRLLFTADDRLVHLPRPAL